MFVFVKGKKSQKKKNVAFFVIFVPETCGFWKALITLVYSICMTNVVHATSVGAATAAPATVVDKVRAARGDNLWDLFCSHNQTTGGQQAHLLCTELKYIMGLSPWFDQWGLTGDGAAIIDVSKPGLHTCNDLYPKAHGICAYV